MTMDGTVSTSGNTWTLRFERDLKHPIEKVWDALTNNSAIKEWLADDGDIELREGGRVRLKDHEIDSTIVDLDPPRVIEYGWRGPHYDGGTVRWELQPTESGTRLELTHRVDVMSPEKAEEFKQRMPDLPEGWEPLPSTLAGWHSILERFMAAVDGSPIGDDMDRWRQLHEHYKVSLTRS
jgi:uncharacterized protein YndB with AHSA1/START domain